VLPPCIVVEVDSEPVVRRTARRAVLPSACGELRLPTIFFAKHARLRGAQTIRLSGADVPIPVPTDLEPEDVPRLRDELPWPSPVPVVAREVVPEPTPDVEINIVESLADSGITAVYESLKRVKAALLGGPRTAEMHHPLEHRPAVDIPEGSALADLESLTGDWFTE
jgi:hypothetical protein